MGATSLSFFVGVGAEALLPLWAHVFSFPSARSFLLLVAVSACPFWVGEGFFLCESRGRVDCGRFFSSKSFFLPDRYDTRVSGKRECGLHFFLMGLGDRLPCPLPFFLQAFSFLAGMTKGKGQLLFFLFY